MARSMLWAVGLAVLAMAMPQSSWSQGASASASAATPSGGCTLPAIEVTVDRDSLVDAGWNADAARIAMIKMGTMASLGRAYYDLCTDGRIAASMFAGKRLLLQNGEGATEPLIYRSEAMPGVLVLQYAYQDGPPPTADQSRQALICLADPNDAGCAAGD